MSAFIGNNLKDEDHCWDGIFAEHARDCWVRRVSFHHLAGSAVNLQKHTSRITVEDCVASDPISEIGGWRRCVFLTRGQQTLVQRCVSRQGIHDYAAGFCAAGPNAFVQCEGEQSLGFSGSIGSWASGLLFDIVNIDGCKGFQLASRLLKRFHHGIHLVGIGQRQVATFQHADGIVGNGPHEQVDLGSPYVKTKNQVFLSYFILFVFIH